MSLLFIYLHFFYFETTKHIAFWDVFVQMMCIALNGTHKDDSVRNICWQVALVAFCCRRKNTLMCASRHSQTAAFTSEFAYHLKCRTHVFWPDMHISPQLKTNVNHLMNSLRCGEFNEIPRCCCFWMEFQRINELKCEWIIRLLERIWLDMRMIKVEVEFSRQTFFNWMKGISMRIPWLLRLFNQYSTSNRLLYRL